MQPAPVVVTGERDAPRLSQRDCLRADLERRYQQWGRTAIRPGRGRFAIALLNPGFQVVVLYRLGRALYLRGWHVPASLLQTLSVWLTAGEIAASSDIGPGLLVTHAVGVCVWGQLGCNTEINGSVLIGTVDGTRSVVAGDDVTFGHGSTTLGHVTIGDGANVGAMTLVLKDVPAGHTAVGIPARLMPPKGA